MPESPLGFAGEDLDEPPESSPAATEDALSPQASAAGLLAAPQAAEGERIVGSDVMPQEETTVKGPEKGMEFGIKDGMPEGGGGDAVSSPHTRPAHVRAAGKIAAVWPPPRPPESPLGFSPHHNDSPAASQPTTPFGFGAYCDSPVGLSPATAPAAALAVAATMATSTAGEELASSSPPKISPQLHDASMPVASPVVVPLSPGTTAAAVVVAAAAGDAVDIASSDVVAVVATPIVDTNIGTTTTAATPAKKPRRKLVRGANKIEAQVLPEFTDACSALDGLDSFLDAVLELDNALESSSTDEVLGEMAERGCQFTGGQAGNDGVAQGRGDIEVLYMDGAFVPAG